jgi:hypothetical protein
LKIVVPHILSVITHLFNFSINTSTFPSAWKTALVLPLPKCGYPTGLSDFRPISILPVLSKGFERLICTQYVEDLDSRGYHPISLGFVNSAALLLLSRIKKAPVIVRLSSSDSRKRVDCRAKIVKSEPNKIMLDTLHSLRVADQTHATYSRFGLINDTNSALSV